MRGEGASWTDGQVNVLSTQTVKDFSDYDITGSTDNITTYSYVEEAKNPELRFDALDLVRHLDWFCFWEYTTTDEIQDNTN